MVSGDETNPMITTNTNEFDHYYFSYPLFFIEKDHLEVGNKIIMPPSALEQLLALPNVVHPMIFRLENSNTGLYSHCGVVEFTAEEGMVYLPTWMMENMKLHEGDLVNIRNTSLPKGTYIKIQPHASKFINLSNHKSLLEIAFRDFACLTTGDTIEINHAGHKYLTDVLETKPSRAISIDNDCVVDFAQPLDYKEPEKKTSVLGKRERTTLGDEDRKSSPEQKDDSKRFPGEGRRLGGTTVPGGNSFDQSMKKLKITEVTTTKKVDWSKQGTIEFKPFLGMAKRLDSQPLVAVAAKDVEQHDQSNARAKVKEEEHQGFKAFTGKSFRLM